LHIRLHICICFTYIRATNYKPVVFTLLNLTNMYTYTTINPLRRAISRAFTVVLIAIAVPVYAQQASTPKLPGVHEAMQAYIDRGDMSGAITIVTSKDKLLHLDVAGLANIERKEPMQANSLFWIASMSKPLTAVSIMMLQDAGKLNVTDQVAKYIPEFANLKTPSGKPANLTITQIMTHTSGLGEAKDADALQAKTLADLIPLFLVAPMQYEPGEKWKYTQSAINVAARIVEVAGGLPFDQFVQTRILNPLGMTHTTFYPDAAALANHAIGYAKNKTTGVLEPVAQPTLYAGKPGTPPLGNGGLFSTGPDYARLCQMLLGNGMYNGKRYLSAAAIKTLTTVQTANLPTGFIANHGADYGWGIGVAIQRNTHDGVGAVLSPGSYGHGGAWGTQAWIDPVRGVAYILMVQRPGINGDAADVRRDFQQAAADALGRVKLSY
jgi:CubicO group peptidase (beta-lactamase class C family)